MNAVITGATKGIGKAIARQLAAAGYHLAICSRNADELLVAIDELQTAYPGVQITGLPADCADADQLNQFVSFVQEHFTHTDVLVNNAGMFRPSPLLAETHDLLTEQWDLNLLAPYRLCKIFGKEMRSRRSGHIVNICSIAAIQPVVAAGSYSVTKAALLALTRVLREELMPDDVKVTAILPGSTFTDSWQGSDADPSIFVSPDDVAAAVLACLKMSGGANVDEIIVRPLRGQV